MYSIFPTTSNNCRICFHFIVEAARQRTKISIKLGQTYHSMTFLRRAQ